jgi:hypothetical protein
VQKYRFITGTNLFSWHPLSGTVTRTICSTRAGVGCGRGGESELFRQDVLSIMTTSIWITGLIGLLLLFLGVLLGTTWTSQAVNRQFRRLAAERRALNAWRLELQQTSVRCVQCGYLIVSFVGDSPEDEENQYGDQW